MEICAILFQNLIQIFYFHHIFHFTNNLLNFYKNLKIKSYQFEGLCMACHLPNKERQQIGHFVSDL